LVRGLPCFSSSVVKEGPVIDVLSIEGGGGEDEGGVGGIVEIAGEFRFRFGELNSVELILRSIVGEGRGFNIEECKGERIRVAAQ
jgi:hypothetical protein